MRDIEEILHEMGLSKDDYELYGRYMAKLSLNLQEVNKKKAKLILVTAMTPTAAGEGKTHEQPLASARHSKNLERT